MNWVKFALIVGAGSGLALVVGAWISLPCAAYKLAIICGFMGAGMGLSCMILAGIGLNNVAPPKREEAP